MAERVRYRGRIDHTEKTIQLLYKTEYYAYEKAPMLVRLGIGVAMVIAAIVVTLPMWVRGILMLIGAWLMASRDFPSMMRADQALEARHGSLPSMHYEFYSDRVALSGEGSMSIPYKKFTRLAEDEAYLYLFLAKNSVCMVDRATLSPGPAEDFMKFIEQKTGLKWRREKSILAMNLWDLRQFIRDIKNPK